MIYNNKNNVIGKMSINERTPRTKSHLLPFIITHLLMMAALLSSVNCESHFIQQPESLTVVDGESVTLKCQASSQEGLEYSWMLNGRPLYNSSRAHQIGANWRINKVDPTLDAGDYICIALSGISGAREATPPAHLDIIWIESANVQLQANTNEKFKDDVILKCHVEGSSDVKVEWFRNGEKVDKSQHFDIQKRKLHIKKATPTDNGIYRCTAHNQAGVVVSKKNYVLKLTDANYPQIEIIPENRAVHEGQTAAMRCSYKNSDNVEWLHKNNLLKNSESVTIDKNGTLVLKNIKENNQGTYLCRGKRGEKVQEFSSELSVVAQLKIIKHPSNVVVKEYEPAIFDCDYSPKNKQTEKSITIRWRKDGKVFRDTATNEEAPVTTSGLESNLVGREEPRIFINRKNGSLVFLSTVSSDEGNFDCQVVGSSGNLITSNRASLQIIELLKFVPQPTSKNLELGSIGKVHCKAQGSPPPLVKWAKDKNTDLPKTVEDINGTLTFKNVTAEHKGNYTCLAVNTQGSINATVSINVVVAPKFFVAPEGPIQALEMGSAMVHCQAKGDPKPTIQWDKDLQYLSNNNTEESRFRILENGTLHILEVHLEDEGKYGCTIGNSAGLKREEIRLSVKPADGFPQEEVSDGFMITRAVLITMSVAFAYIILVIGLMLWCRYRRQARKARINLAGKENGEVGDGENKNGEIEPCLPLEASNGKVKSRTKRSSNNTKKSNGGTTEAQKSDDTASSANSKGSKKSMSNYDQITMPRNSLMDLIQIGRGEFGDVLVGKILSADLKTVTEVDDESDSTKITTENEKRRSKVSIEEINEIKKDESCEEYKLVLVKALNKSSIKDECVCMEFKRQIDLFRGVNHRNVARLYGLCRDKDPHYIVLQYADWGDLKQFLLATSGTANTHHGSKPPPLKIPQVLAIAHQVARAMDAIYKARYIHKDLATRNCIIASNFNVKVSYPALSKDKYAREYYRHANQLVPLRWLAPECLQDDDYSAKSDVFAYGVFVWEVFTQATHLPFEELSNEEFLPLARDGKLEWQTAVDTPEEMKTILHSCWKQNPKERPSFSQLISALGNCLQSEYPKDPSSSSSDK